MLWLDIGCGRTREFTLVFTPNSGVLSATADFSLSLLVMVCYSGNSANSKKVNHSVTTLGSMVYPCFLSVN